MQANIGRETNREINSESNRETYNETYNETNNETNDETNNETNDKTNNETNDETKGELNREFKREPNRKDEKKPDRKPTNLRSMKYYILNALKFHELKNENLTPIIFVIILFTSFSGTLISDNMAESVFTNIIYTLVSVLILYTASTTYLFAYLKELRGEECTFKFCMSQVFKKLLKILMAYIAFIAIIFTGMFLLVIPGIIFYHMFMFNICYLLDKDIGVVEAFNASKNLTAGRKMDVFSIFVVFNLILFIPLVLIVIIASYTPNNLMFNFIISFITTMLTIMQQRLIAMLYVDMEYGFQ